MRGRPWIARASLAGMVALLPASSSHAAVRHEGALVLEVFGDADGLRIESAAWTPRAISNTPTAYEGGAPRGAVELVIGFYTRRGRLLETARYPGYGVTFSDRLPPAGGDDETVGPLSGGLSLTLRQNRTLEVPLPRDAFYMVLAWAVAGNPDGLPRTPELPDLPPLFERIVPPCFGSSGCAQCVTGRFAVQLYGASVYRVGRKTGPFAERAAWSEATLGPLVQGSSPMVLKCPPVLPPPPSMTCRSIDGSFAKTEVLHQGTHTRPRYEIVILGDGFQTAELSSTFETMAKKVSAALLAAEPYRGARDRIDVYAVYTDSVDSGISDCSTPGVTLRTYYAVKGDCPDLFGVPGWKGLFCTDAKCRVRWAIEQALPHWWDADLVVMIPNCAVDGGNANPWEKMIFLATGLSDLGPIAVHEAGHSVAWLGEEYIACAPEDKRASFPFPDYFPNVAHERERATVWWKSLLQPMETAAGDFAAVHVPGNPFQACTSLSFCPLGCHGNACMPQMPPNVSNTWLGWYWGAQYGTEDCSLPSQFLECCFCDRRPRKTSLPGIPPHCGGSPCDANPPYYCGGKASTKFYRPAAVCRMSTLNPKVGYCRACETKVREAIDRVAPP